MDQALALNAGRSAAAQYLQGCNLEIIKAAGQRRQRHYVAGARAPGSIAGAPVQLRVMDGPDVSALKDGREPSVEVAPIRKTEIGLKTAVRQQSRVLAHLAADDPRLAVAEMVGAAVERIGAIGGGGGEATASSGGISDGGVTTRIKHAQRLRMITAIANGWAVDGLHGNIAQGYPKVVMPVKRKRGNRQEIKAITLLLSVCVDGKDLSDVLKRHGWTVCSQHTSTLRKALMETLHDIAAYLGHMPTRQSKEA